MGVISRVNGIINQLVNRGHHLVGMGIAVILKKCPSRQGVSLDPTKTLLLNQEKNRS